MSKVIALTVTDAQEGSIVKWNPFQEKRITYMNPDGSGNNISSLWEEKSFVGEQRVHSIRKGCWIYINMHYARQQLLVKGVDYD